MRANWRAVRSGNGGNVALVVTVDEDYRCSIEIATYSDDGELCLAVERQPDDDALHNLHQWRNCEPVAKNLLDKFVHLLKMSSQVVRRFQPFYAVLSNV